MQPLLHDAELVYLYDGTLEGLFTAVFCAFDEKQYPVNIVTEDNLQMNLLESYVPIHAELNKAERVKASILDRFDLRSYQDITSVFLSDNEHKGGIILRYLQYLFKRGPYARSHLAHPAVRDFEEVLLEVKREAHFMKMFVRFAQTQGGVFFSRIEPKASVVPLIMDHFAARFNIQPFMLYDARHRIAGVFNTKTWHLVDTAAGELSIPENSPAEDDFQALWQSFFDTIAIEERSNPVCQRNFMPKRFWGNMCEHIPPQLRKQQPTTEAPSATAKRLSNTTKALPLPSQHDW